MASDTEYGVIRNVFDVIGKLKIPGGYFNGVRKITFLLKNTDAF